jgi:hypothetical protein
VACADLALNAASYAAGNKITLTSTDRWDDYTAAASDPISDIQTGREAVRSQIGVRPNVLTLGPKVLTSLRSHPKILDRLSTAADRPPATLAQLAALLEIERVIEGGMIYHTGAAFVDVWGTFAHLAYVTPRSMQEMGSPSFGYTYQLRDYPIAEESYYGRNEKTWYFPVTDARQPVLALRSPTKPGGAMTIPRRPRKRAIMQAMMVLPRPTTSATSTPL